MAIGSASPVDDSIKAEVRGRDLMTGLPKNIVLTPEEVREAIDEQVSVLAADYQLQMQAYALALRELLGIKTGSGSDRVRSSLTINSLRATLHFLDPNIEISLAASFLEQEVCSRAIDEAMTTITSLEGLLDAERFPPFPAIHCRICNFRDLCPAGRDWLRGNASV